MKKTTAAIIARYNELQPENVSIFNPRQGFYLINEVIEDCKFVLFYKAKALWKEHQTDKFNSGAEVIIQLTSFHESAPNPQDFDPKSLVGKIINVFNISLSTKMLGLILYPIIKCDWTIDHNFPAIESTAPYSFFDTITDSLLDFNKQFNESLGDISSIDMDNQFIGEAYPVEDNSQNYPTEEYPDKDFDEPDQESKADLNKPDNQ